MQKTLEACASLRHLQLGRTNLAEGTGQETLPEPSVSRAEKLLKQGVICAAGLKLRDVVWLLCSGVKQQTQVEGVEIARM